MKKYFSFIALLFVFLSGSVIITGSANAQARLSVEKVFNQFNPATDTSTGWADYDGYEVEVTNANADSIRTFSIQGIQWHDGRTGYALGMHNLTIGSRVLPANDSILTGTQVIPASTTKVFRIDARSVYGFILTTEGRAAVYIRIRGMNTVRR